MTLNTTESCKVGAHDYQLASSESFLPSEKGDGHNSKFLRRKCLKPSSNFFFHLFLLVELVYSFILLVLTF